MEKEIKEDIKNEDSGLKDNEELTPCTIAANPEMARNEHDDDACDDGRRGE